MQLENCRKYCDLKGLENIEVFTDLDIGGRSDERPEFNRMMSLVDEKKISNIVCYAMARFSRSRQTFLQSIAVFKKKKVAFHSVKEMLDLSTPVGRLIADILSSLNEFEVEQLAERTSDNLQLRKSNLLTYTKNAPYGFQNVDGKLVVDKDENKLLTYIFSLKNEGVKSPTIANVLNREKFKPRKGTKFYQSSVESIFNNERFYKDKGVI